MSVAVRRRPKPSAAPSRRCVHLYEVFERAGDKVRTVKRYEPDQPSCSGPRLTCLSSTSCTRRAVPISEAALRVYMPEVPAVGAFAQLRVPRWTAPWVYIAQGPGVVRACAAVVSNRTAPLPFGDRR